MNYLTLQQLLRHTELLQKIVRKPWVVGHYFSVSTDLPRTVQTLSIRVKPVVSTTPEILQTLNLNMFPKQPLFLQKELFLLFINRVHSLFYINIDDL